MSNSRQPDDSKEDALAALHGLGDGGESADHEDGEHEGTELAGGEGREDSGASSAASGFVGMLAKEGTAGAAGQASGMPLRRKPDAIRMAREIKPAPPPVMSAGDGGRAGAKRQAKKIPGWYHAAVPVMYTLGALLILIGLWAVGALIYMAVKTPAGPEDVGYPWISWHVDAETDVGAYTSGSKAMAIVMLVCLPVSLAMAFMGGMMRKQIRAAGK